ncbi:hypothetical protein TI05_08990 [Achromatium sp. WMS3]|nr:hypothetical protein TI05_08990 [Achromatium sp. WMS3]
MKYSLHPDAKQDMKEAATYYKERGGKRLAQTFFSDFERSISLLTQSPLLGASWLHNTRRLVMHHFPYSIVYKILDTKICVIAVSHNSRRPDYWKKRIQ